MKRRAAPIRTPPGHVPEPGGFEGAIEDLFAIVKVIGEDSLLRRLQQAGADVYCDGEFPTLCARLRHVIQREQLVTAVCGRSDTEKVETYAQAFERVYGEALINKGPRGTRNT